MTAGFIVVENQSGPQHEAERGDVAGVLFAGGFAVTIFPTRSRATTAIRRTVRWSRSLSRPWRETDYRIMRLVPSIATPAALTLAERERRRA